MNKINIQYFNTPFGELILGSYQNQICLCDWRYRKLREEIDQRMQSGLDADYIEAETVVIIETKKQLFEYFKRERKEFDIPLKLVGTTFQQNIWNELLNISYGKTETYLGLSKKIKNTKAIRAVAAANGANAISIIVPCHRIVGSNGDLIGYAGGLSVKKKLLKLESNQLQLFE